MDYSSRDIETLWFFLFFLTDVKVQISFFLSEALYIGLFYEYWRKFFLYKNYSNDCDNNKNNDYNLKWLKEQDISPCDGGIMTCD